MDEYLIVFFLTKTEKFRINIKDSVKRRIKKKRERKGKILGNRKNSRNRKKSGESNNPARWKTPRVLAMGESKLFDTKEYVFHKGSFIKTALV